MRYVRFRMLGVLLLAVLWPARADALQTPELDALLPTDPAVVIDSLENGLRYYIRANQRPENRAELRLVVNAGSVLEDEDQRGLAHFVEHMAFNGTRNFAQQELVRYLESIGMRFGADLNASTSFDETVYSLTVPTDRSDVIVTAFQILSDWADGVLFETAEIDKERGVVIEEWRGRLGAGSRVADAQYPVVLGGSRYADRLPIGRVETLESFEPETLIRFYQRWYRPDLMAIIAVGDFDPDAIEGLIRESFGPIERPATPADRPIYDVPSHDETRFLVVSDPELTTTRVDLLHKQPARRINTFGEYGQLLIERLYNSMLNARLSEITQRPDAPFVAASSGRGPLVRSAGAYTLAAIVPDGEVETGLAALLTEAERVSRHGFAPTELDRARANLLRGLERAHAERATTNSGSYVSEYVRHFLSDEPIPGIEFEYEAAQLILPQVEVEALNQLGRDWITEEDRVVLASAPRKEGELLPDAAELRRVLASVEAATIEPYQDSAVDAPLLAAVPDGTPVLEEVLHDDVGVVEWRLGNGVRVLLKPTDFRDDEILLRASSSGGLSIAPDDQLLSASFATDVAQVSGVGTFNAIELRNVLAGRAASASPFITETEQGFSGAASPRDLETMLQLVHLYFTAPRLDPTAVGAMMQQLRVVLANRDADPASAYSDTLQATLTQNHPRFEPLTTERLEEIDFERALGFYRDRFTDASGFTFALVGNLDPDSVRPLVETYLGGLPASGREEEWVDHGVEPPGGLVSKVVRRGLEPRAQTRIVFAGELEYSREAAYLLRSLASVLDLRLRDILREDLGGTYGAQVSANASRQPAERYAVSIGFGSAPERLEDLTGATLAEIERLKDEGPTDEEVGRIREIQRRERETSLRQNGYWIGQMIAYDREGMDLSEILTYERLIDDLTPQAVRDAARTWLPADRYVRVSLLPAEQAAAE